MSRQFMKVRNGISAPGISAQPSDPANGDMFYNTTANVFQQYINGAWQNVGTSSTSGTVTSVAASVPSFLSISGSPITGSGTLAISYSGTALPVANGGTGVTTSTGTGNTVLSNSPTLVTPALGTPSALVGTNITGTATSFTASNVTTNANLTGPITSSGNATSIASQTGTGTKFVVNTSPTIITPTITTSAVIPLVIGGSTASSTLTLESTSGTGTTDSIVFKTGSQATAVTVTSAGNLGVGVSPTQPLEVAGGTGAIPTSGNTSTAAFRILSGGAVLDFNANSSTNAWIQATNAGDLSQKYALSINPNGGAVSIAGSSTNDSAASGNVGEYIQSFQSSYTNVPGANAAYGDATSISLTAGDWDVTYLVVFHNNGATATFFDIGISTTSGNNGFGLQYGNNLIEENWTANANSNQPASIPSYRMSLASTTTVYAKMLVGYSAGTPQSTYRLSARRMR